MITLGCAILSWPYIALRDANRVVHFRFLTFIIILIVCGSISIYYCVKLIPPLFSSRAASSHSCK